MSTKRRVISKVANSRMELELYRRMHADWLLSPFAIYTHIFQVDSKARRLLIHKNWRLETQQVKLASDIPKSIPFGKGIAGRVAIKGEMIYAPNVREYKSSHDFVEIVPNTGSSLGIPVKGRNGELLAVIRVDSPHTHAFDDPYVKRLFKGYAKQAALTLTLNEPGELDRALSDLEVKIEMAYLLVHYLRPIYRAIRALNPGHQILIFLADPERKELTLFQTGNFSQIDKFIPFVAYGEGVTGRAALQSTPIYERDTKKIMGKDYIEISKGTRSNFAVPIFSGSELLGVFDIENPTSNAFPARQRKLIENYCHLATAAILSAQRLHLDIQEHHFLQAIRELTHSLVIQPTRRQVCDLVVQKAVELTGAVFGCIQIYEKLTDNLIMLSVWPNNQRDRILDEYGVIKKGQGITGQAAQKLEPIWIADIHQLKKPDEYLASLDDIRTELAVPLYSKHGQLAGVLNVEWSASTRPIKSQAIRQLEALADIAVVGLSSAQISESVEDRVRLGRDKIAVMVQLAYSILHDSMPKITLARLSLQESRQFLDRVGTQIEDNVPGTDIQDFAQSKQEILDTLLEADLSLILTSELLADFRRDWEEFKLQTQGLSTKEQANENRITIQDAVQDAIKMAMQREVLKNSVMLEIDLGNLSNTIMTPSLVLILSQLIANAGECMSERGTLRIDANRWEQDPTLVEIRVSDTGGGIAPDIRERIFEPFYSSRKEIRASRGLGLYIARATAEASGGWLGLIDGYFPDGATFALRLPLGIG